MRRLVIALAVAFSGFAPQFALAQKIGVASSVKNDLQRVAPAPAQAVGAGSSLIANEHLRTGEASSAQLLFLDETSVSMGAQSDLVLDRFVYNPNRASWKRGSVHRAWRAAFRHRVAEPDQLYDQHAGREHRRARHDCGDFHLRGVRADLFAHHRRRGRSHRNRTVRAGGSLDAGNVGPCLERRGGRGPIQGGPLGDQHRRHCSDVRTHDSNNNADVRRSR